MATILELAELSAAVYGDYPTPSDWSVLTSSTQINPAWAIDGYYGVAYQNNATHEIVIANRGTDTGNLANLLNNLASDAQLALGGATKVQTDAANFALAIAGQYGGSIIETGHSLGGSEAQAATVALTAQGFSVSAVTFNSPGIGGVFVPAGVSYTVQNFYDQGDAIHLAGGAHLGLSTMIPAGPNTSSLFLATPLAVATGPIGAVGLFGAALWEILGLAHSIINTVIPYLQVGNPLLGQTGWSAAGSAAPISLGATGASTGPTMSVNAAGALVLTDAGDSVTLTASSDQQSIIATFSGSGSAIFQQLTAMGTVSIPASELNQVVTGLTSASTINETVTQNPNNADTFNVAFQNAGAPNSADQFTVNVANPGSAFNYVVPSNEQAVVETIDNGTNTTGTVSIITDTGTTQLTGGTAVAGTDNTWTDGNGDQYVFDASTGALTITQGLLSNSSDQIVINNFDINAAQTNANGYLGIKFSDQLAVAASANAADDPFTNGGTYTAATQAASVATGNVQTVTVYASAISATDQTVTLSGGSGSLFISTGADLLAFNGTLNLIIPAGQDHVTFGLVDAGNASQSVNLSATLTNADGTVSSINTSNDNHLNGAANDALYWNIFMRKSA